MELHPSDFHFPEFLEGIAEMDQCRTKGISLIYETVSPIPQPSKLMKIAG